MKKRTIILAIITAAIILFLSFGVVAGFAYAITVKHDESHIVREASKIFPIPAGRVGEKTLLYRDFLQTLDAVRKFSDSPAAKSQNLTAPPDSVLEKNLFEHMLYIAGIEDEATRRKFAVSEEELRAYFADVVSAASSTSPDVASYLYKNYGWNEEDFRQNVLKPALLEDRLSYEMSKNAEGDPKALTNFMTQRMKNKDVKRYLKF